MLSQIFKNVYMRLDEKAVTMAQPQKMWSGIHAWSYEAAILLGSRGDSSISGMPGCGPNALPKNWI